MRLYFIIINIRTIPIENVIYRFYIADYLGNNRVVFDQAGNIEQVNHYYPYGGVFAEGNRISTQPYKFGGKELDRMNGLDTYDFGARQLDYALPSWTAIDPKAEKYYSISPYAYCAGNPIANIDPDGKDYIMYIDIANCRITITATYYASTKDINSAQKAADYWNGQSGDHKWGDFTVDFSLSVVEVETSPNMSETDINNRLNEIVADDKSGGANMYQVVNDNTLGSNTNGRTLNGNEILIKNSQSKSSTGAHEMGHTLGLEHSSSGLMTPASTDLNRSNTITKNNINDIMKYPLNNRKNGIAGFGKLIYFNNSFSTDKRTKIKKRK